MAPTAPTEKAKQELPQNSQDLSDDELAGDEPTWEWIYNSTPTTERSDDPQSDRKRRKVVGDRIVGAKIGQFECRIGDTVMLKADGFNEVWVALICEFVEDDGEGEKAANFMWFSTEREIRNKDKKRTDFFPVRYKLCKTAEPNLTSLSERTLPIPIMGHQPPGVRQWEG
jgi:origin recognition complex subunit 1